MPDPAPAAPTIPRSLPSYPEFSMVDDPSVASKWEDWLEGLEAMIDAMQVTDCNLKKSWLTHFGGQDVRKLLKKLDQSEGDNVYDKAVKALTKFFAPQMNRVYLMNSFLQVKQRPSETVDSFYMRVKEKAEPLAFDKLEKDEIIELVTLAQLVNNCCNSSLRKKALKDGMKLKDFLSNARAIERADQQAKEIERSEASANAEQFEMRGRKKRRKVKKQEGKRVEDAIIPRPVDRLSKTDLNENVTAVGDHSHMMENVLH